MIKSVIAVAIILTTATVSAAQDMPADYLHYWGQGPAQKLAAAVRAAVDKTGPRR